MAIAFLSPYTGSLTLVVSPHRAGLTVDAAYALLRSIHTDDLESPSFAVWHALTEITETRVQPDLPLPDPAPGCPVAHVEFRGTATRAQADDLLARWEHAYAQVAIHEPL